MNRNYIKIVATMNIEGGGFKLPKGIKISDKGAYYYVKDGKKVYLNQRQQEEYDKQKRIKNMDKAGFSTKKGNADAREKYYLQEDLKEAQLFLKDYTKMLKSRDYTAKEKQKIKKLVEKYEERVATIKKDLKAL